MIVGQKRDVRNGSKADVLLIRSLAASKGDAKSGTKGYAETNA
jgi:hypothetical protein